MQYADLVSPENIFVAFDEFKRGKRKKEEWIFWDMFVSLIAAPFEQRPRKEC